MLTHDILCEVASVSGRNELFSLMLISRDLQLHCAKYVLRDNVYLNTTRGFASFILFMGRNQSRRWRYLRSLSFGENRIDSDVAGALGKVISGASNLEILHFKHAEIVLGSHPQLGLGLAAVSTIKYAVLQRVGQHACRMLEAMFWPLETAVLDQDIVGQDDSLERLHPAVLLKNSRKTLQLLRYNRWTAYDSRLPEYPIYPALHSLDFADAWLPPASQWSLAYPNLKHLDVCSLDADYHGMDLATATRVTNLQEHAEFGCWPALEHFTGSVLELYALGLPCRILDVDIIVSSTTVESLEPALSVARPSRLTIRVWQHELYEGRTPELELPSYLRIPGLAEVKSLTLEIDAGGPVPTANMDAFLEQTYAALAHLDLREFILNVNYSRQDSIYQCVESNASDEEDEEESEDRDRSPSPLPCPLEIWGETVDMRAIAPSAFHLIRSLEAFEVSIEYPDLILHQHPRASRTLHEAPRL